MCVVLWRRMLSVIVFGARSLTKQAFVMSLTQFVQHGEINLTMRNVHSKSLLCAGGRKTMEEQRHCCWQRGA